MMRGLLAEDLAVPMRPGRWPSVDRSTVFGPAAKPQHRGRTELVVLPTNATADQLVRKPPVIGREDVGSASGPASSGFVLGRSSVGGLGPGLTSESADAARAVLLTIRRPGPRLMAPTGVAGLICLAWARGRGSQVRAASGCVPSLNLRKGWP